MTESVIVSACRTAVGKFGGSLSTVPASKLGAAVIQGLLARSGVSPDAIDDVVMGQVLTAGVGQNPARQAALYAHLSQSTTAMTINHVCGSGIRAIVLADQAIKSGDADIVIAGGQENMSATPHILNNSRTGIRLGNGQLIDSMVYDGLTDVFNQYHMGITAENIVRQYGVSREEQDEFACASQNKAEAADQAGKFEAEIIPIEVALGRGKTMSFEKDEFIRAGTTIESLNALKPVFEKEGTVTTGNASGINDGAAGVLVMSAKKAMELNLSPLAKIKAHAFCGLAPEIMGMGPTLASRKCLAKAQWDIDSIDLLEMNEAFAAQAVAVNKEMGWDINRVNVNGGAIAIGHPIGASGARILVTLLHEMQRRDVKRGLAGLCIGGGMGIALAVER